MNTIEKQICLHAWEIILLLFTEQIYVVFTLWTSILQGHGSNFIYVTGYCDCLCPVFFIYSITNFELLQGSSIKHIPMSFLQQISVDQKKNRTGWGSQSGTLVHQSGTSPKDQNDFHTFTVEFTIKIMDHMESWNYHIQLRKKLHVIVSKFEIFFCLCKIQASPILLPLTHYSTPIQWLYLIADHCHHTYDCK